MDEAHNVISPASKNAITSATKPVNMNISADLGIDKQDMVAILSAKAERQLREQIQAATRTLKEKQAQLDLTIGKINNAVAAFATPYLNKLKELQKAVIEFGFSVKDVGAESELVETDKKTTIHTNAWMKFFDSTTQRGYGYNSEQTLSKGFSDTPSTEVVALITERSGYSKEVEGIQKEIIGFRQQLANLPSLERQARAQLAISVLQQSDEGKNILSGLEGFDVKGTLALPQ